MIDKNDIIDTDTEFEDDIDFGKESPEDIVAREAAEAAEAAAKNNEGKTPEKLEAEKIAAEEKAAEGKTPEQIEEERIAAEEAIEAEKIAAEKKAEEDKNKTPEEIEAERIAAEEKAAEGKTPEQIEEERIAAEEAIEENDDFFASESDDKGGNDNNKDIFNFKELSTDFDIEVKTKEEFKTKINEKIEDAKKEFKLDKYSPDAKSIIKHLNENDGKLDDFFNNEEIATMQAVIASTPEQKIQQVKTNEFINTGMNAKDASTKAAEEISELSTRELKDISDNINNQAKDLISKEVESIVGNRDKSLQEQRQKDEAKNKVEIDDLKTYINAQEEYMGIKLSPEARKNIVRDVESGVFDEVVGKSREESNFTAYMNAKFGGKIKKTLEGKLSEQNRLGHNSAIDKSTSALHKVASDVSGKKTGHNKQKNEGGNFSNWASINFEEE